MAVVGVGRASDDLAANLLEFLHSRAECDDLGGTNKGEILGVKEENNVFALEIG